MRIRATDDDNDWQLGRGQNDYKRDNNAVLQDINSRLLEFSGDCFFDAGKGVDWFGLLGSKDQVSLNLSISSVILNTQDVIGINQILTRLDSSRRLTLEYQVQTSFSRSPVQGFVTLPVEGSI